MHFWHFLIQFFKVLKSTLIDSLNQILFPDIPTVLYQLEQGKFSSIFDLYTRTRIKYSHSYHYYQNCFVSSTIFRYEWKTRFVTSNDFSNSPFEYWGSHLELAVAKFLLKLAIITTISFAKPSLTKTPYSNVFKQIKLIKQTT